MKPVALMARAIQNSTKGGQFVYEPFSGSGTTLAACEQLGRRCRALELDPRFVDVAVRRWQELTGKKAVLNGDGRSWEELRAERSVPQQETPALAGVGGKA